MLSREEIIEYCSTYKVVNDKIINIKTTQEVTDTNMILKIKSAILIYREAHLSYKEDLQQFGKVNRSKEQYIEKTMEKFGVNGEKNNYGINKLVNAILSSDGHYEEMMGGGNLTNSKFSILVEPKKDFTLAYLRMLSREQGFDFENLQVSQDLSELKHNGVSKVIIDFKKKTLKRETENKDSNSITFSHPKAADLNYLEEQKRLAKKNNDEEAYNYAVKNIERIVSENQVVITEEQWDKMTNQEKVDFIKLKMNESIVLKDKEAFNYWNANLKHLQEMSKENVEDIENHSSPSQEKQEQSEFQLQINNLRKTLDDISKEYHKMLADSYIDVTEKRTLIKRIKDLEEDAHVIKPLATNYFEKELLASIIEILKQEQEKMLNGLNNARTN